MFLQRSFVEPADVLNPYLRRCNHNHHHDHFYTVGGNLSSDAPSFSAQRILAKLFSLKHNLSNKRSCVMCAYVYI